MTNNPCLPQFRYASRSTYVRLRTNPPNTGRPTGESAKYWCLRQLTTSTVKLLYLCLAALCATIPGLAQSETALDPWTTVGEATDLPTGRRLIRPDRARTLQLDVDALRELLDAAPLEGTAPGEVLPQLVIPLADGTEESFRLAEYHMLEPALRAKFPAVRTYHGRGTRDAHHRIRLDWTAAGFRAMLHLDGRTAFVDPYAQGDTTYYLSYFKADYPAPETPFYCATETDKAPVDPYSPLTEAGDCQLRTYRLAVATTGEYSNYFNATGPADAALVLAEVVNSVNRVNSVYETDFGVRLLLINNTDAVFYYNGNTDPYTNSNGSTMLGQNATTLANVIGNANFDIGHVYSTGGGGVAVLRSPCGGNKARGVTGQNVPTGDPFWIDYVAHEMGHQFGGNHTQNNNCNRSNASMEPGSASTIMGYAGICSPNVQNNSDAYFHAVSIAEVAAFITGSGNSCANVIANPNNAPTVNAGNNYTIPGGTPFFLTAAGADVDGDALTYCWEQYDNETGTMPPQPTNAQGPLFRSLFPTPSNIRYFPALGTVLSNGNNTWEVLPTVSRTLDFRVTVRDNSTNAVSCTDEDDMTVTVAGGAGPFRVTAPNTSGVSWLEGSTENITWDVANTTAAPVSCAAVDIELSYDGGQTFTTTLLAGAANTGSASIVVPAGTTNAARVRVRCADNIFYDLSNSNFTIDVGGSTFTLTVPSTSEQACVGQAADYSVTADALNGFAANVSLATTGLPAGAVATFSNNPVGAGGSSVLSLDGSSVAPGTYTFDLTGSSGGTVRTRTLTWTVDAVPGPIALSQPADNAMDVSSQPTFDWTAAAGTAEYTVQLASDPGFTDVQIEATVPGNTWTPPNGLAASTTYYWRVRGALPCPGPYGAARSFTTGTCVSAPRTANLAISSQGTPTINSVNTLTTQGTIVEVEVQDIIGTHTYMSDLVFTLIAPDGTSVLLIDRECGSSNNFSISLSDAATTPVDNAGCSPLGQGGTFQPESPLNVLVGKPVAGNWTLRVEDVANQDGGALSSWTLRVCISTAALPVVWHTFTARPEMNAIQLDWTTTQERYNAGFIVERRNATETTFAAIGEVAPVVDPTQRNAYEWLDKDVRAGVAYYYRIRQVDTDGSVNYSEVRTAQLAAGSTDFSVFPNPVANQLTITTGTSTDEPTQLQLYDARGRLLHQAAFSGPTHELTFATYPPGIYLLDIRRAHQREFVRLVKP